MRRALIILASLAVLAGGLWGMLRSPAPVILLTDIVAHPVPGAPQSVLVTMTVQNPGGPDMLVNVRSPAARLSMLKSMKTRGLPIPARASPSLSMDAGHIMLMGLAEPATEGAIVPFTVTFARAGEMSAKAIVRATAMDHGVRHEVGADRPVPQIKLAAKRAGESWVLRVEVENFVFSNTTDQPHALGHGHGHLYVDGMKIGRVFVPDITLGALPAGPHTVELGLYTNDHRAYTKDGELLRAEIELPGE